MNEYQTEVTRIESILTDQTLYEKCNQQKLQDYLSYLTQAKEQLEQAESEWLILSEQLH